MLNEKDRCKEGAISASLANLTVVFVGRCGDCGLVGIPLARLVALRAGRRRVGGSVSALLAWLTVIVAVRCGNCGTADFLLVCSEVLRAGRCRDGGVAGLHG